MIKYKKAIFVYFHCMNISRISFEYKANIFHNNPGEEWCKYLMGKYHLTWFF